MVRILTRLGKVRKEMAAEHAEQVDFQIGSISGDLRAIIADEDVDVKAGEAKPIKIKKLSLPANTLTYMSAYAENRLGHPIAVGEETPLPITMDRHADYTMFMTAIDGRIEKEDLLGVVIILPINLTHKSV